MKPKRLLVLDDDVIICEYILDVAQSLGYEVAAGHRPEELFSELKRFAPDVVLLDLVLPGTDGIELLRGLAETHCQVPVLIMSGLDKRTIQAAERLGCEHGLNMCGRIEKPFTSQALRGVLEGVLTDRRSIGEEDLENAIANDELVLYFQPKVSTRTGEPVGAEALVRWQHPIHGLLSPASFVPLAEASGQIRALTRTVSRLAIAQASAWHQCGLPISVAINISTHDLNDLGFPDQLDAILREHGVDGSQIILEVTESQVMSNTVEATEILTRLRLKGVEVAIDDFGTGFSSMALLQRLPFSEIKVDQSFVREATTSRDARIIVRSIIDLGHNLGMRVVAEGVEDTETWNLLSRMGCDVLQGFAIGQPMPSSTFRHWMSGFFEARQAGA